MISETSKSLNYDLIVIGGGAGGLVSAGFAASLGAKVALVSEGPLGGECLYTGCVPSKALIHAASMSYLYHKSSQFGFAAANDAPSFRPVFDYMRSRIDIIAPNDSPETMARYGVDAVFRGKASFLDPYNIMVNGQQLSSTKFILATGAEAFVPNIDGLEEVGYVTHEGMMQLSALPERLAILGGGPIGIEFAQMMHRFGSEVWVIERGTHILPKEEPEVSYEIKTILEAEGVHFLLNTELQRVERNDKEKSIFLFSEIGGQTTLTVNELLIAIGKKPRISGLNLAAAGVRLDEKGGIQINEKCQTSAKHIYAVGDVTNRFQFTHYAEHQAKVAVMNALLKFPKRMEKLLVPWVTYLDPEVAHVGLTITQAQQKYGENSVTTFRYDFQHSDRAIVDNASEGFILWVLKKNGRILGVSIVGKRAGELIHEATLAMRHRMKLQELSEIIHAYPTYSDIIQKSATQYAWNSYQNSVLGRIIRLWFQRENN